MKQLRLAVVGSTLVGVLVALSAAASVNAPRWGPPQVVGSLRGEGQATELKTVDMNRDGLRDVVVVQLRYPSFDTFPVTVLLNRGRGRLVDATSSLFEGPALRSQWARKIVVSDFNGDGRPDIFVADHGTDVESRLGHQNELALSTPSGHLVDATANLPQQSDFTHSADAADVDGNGTVDLYLGNFSCCGDHTPPELLLNDGTGHFTVAPGRLDGGAHGSNFSPYTASLFADLNGDRSPDLLLGGMNSARSIILLNDGHGLFHYFADLPEKLYGATGNIMDLVSIDLNGDGALDLLSAETPEDPYYIGTKIQALVNDGHGVFHDETPSRFPNQPIGQSWPNRLLLEDMNDDGKLDLAVQYAPQGIIRTPDPTPFWLNRGDGVFEPVAGPRSGASSDARGPVGFVNGAGPHALVSVEASANGALRRYYISPQLVGPTPAGVVASRKLRSGILVTWHAVPGATGYEIWRGSSRKVRGRRVGTVAKTRFFDRRARLRRVYYYRVRAFQPDGASDFSKPATGRRR